MSKQGETNKCGLCHYEGGPDEVKLNPPVYNKRGKEVAYIKAVCINRDDCRDRQFQRVHKREPEEIAEMMSLRQDYFNATTALPRERYWAAQGFYPARGLRRRR